MASSSPFTDVHNNIKGMQIIPVMLEMRSVLNILQHFSLIIMKMIFFHHYTTLVQRC